MPAEWLDSPNKDFAMTASPPNPPVTLVTGGANRVGAVLCRRLADARHRVVIHYRGSRDAAEALRADIAASGGEAGLVQADLEDRAQRQGLIADAGKIFGPLTGLINNASTFSPDAVDDLDEGLWDEHFTIHAEAPIFLSRDFARQLPDGVEGNIVNIVDERVLHPSPAYFSYFLSKSVLATATTTLAQSLAPNIRVNAIAPGPTLKHTGQSDEAFARGVKSLPLERHADPDALADGLLFILTARAMTGHILTLDGGRHVEFPPKRGKTPRR
jgi:NAD(P)-dependent dehydrogenase (short-subunit alcohol dehydrogenase family)